MDIEELIEDLDEMVRLLNVDDITGLATWLRLSSSVIEIRKILEKYKKESTNRLKITEYENKIDELRRVGVST